MSTTSGLSSPAQMPPRAPSILLGLGFGGFVDGILLHQILQWHHMVSGHGHEPTDGFTETILTGDEADKVQAEVEAAYPDATIERMETDAEGAAFEAHIVQANGTAATVKLDSSYAITGTEAGHGVGPGRGRHHDGPGRDHDGDDGTGSDTVSSGDESTTS